MSDIRIFRDNVEKQGYGLLKAVSYASAVEAIEYFGDTFKIEIIEEKKNSQAKLSSSESMPLHTDHPCASYIAWFCESPAGQGGESLIADARSVIECLSEEETDQLKSIILKFPSLTENKYYNHPLLSEGGIYFADWLIDSELAINNHALANFIQKINSIERKEILLDAGDLLLIDNRRMLHGRNQFSESEPKRKLIRHWISSFK